jgi:hypothetical protein
MQVAIFDGVMKLLTSNILDEICRTCMKYHLLIKSMYIHLKCSDIILWSGSLFSDFIHFEIENILLNILDKKNYCFFGEKLLKKNWWYWPLCTLRLFIHNLHTSNMQGRKFWPSISCILVHQMKQTNIPSWGTFWEGFKELRLVFELQAVCVLWAFEDLSLFAYCLLFFGDYIQDLTNYGQNTYF